MNLKQNKNVRAKKSFGQHFLRNTAMARVIARTVHTGYTPQLMPDGSLDLPAAGALAGFDSVAGSAKIPVLEIGPGMGVLTQRLWEDGSLDVKMVEVDAESVVYLRQNFPDKTGPDRLFAADFLKLDLNTVFGSGKKFIVTGNFPYNISSQILFKCLEHRDTVPVVCGMFQKEVGERVCAKPGSKQYGILSVLLQAFYRTEYLFTVEPTEFTPPPRVRSCVIRLQRNDTTELGCDEKLFAAIVKKGFNQRRKTLRNALKTLEDECPGFLLQNVPEKFLNLRAEQLSVADYVEIGERTSSSV